jgi:26S proteasome regulatory subunit N8
MFRMFRKVNNKEEIVGFYSTGPKLKENDLKIAALFRRFSEHEPVFIIIDVRPGIEGLPTTAYEAQEEVEGQGKEIQWVFKHIPCTIEAEEAEAVGVEHLVRDINDPSTSTLALQIKEKIAGLNGLATKLVEIREYLELTLQDKLPMNNQITYNLQNILNLLPNLNVDVLVRSMQIKTNDMHLVMYISSLVRSVVALHSLLLNKVKHSDMDDILDSRAGVDEITLGGKGEEKKPEGDETKQEPSPGKKNKD